MYSVTITLMTYENKFVTGDSIRYEGGFFIVRSSNGDELAIPATLIKEINATKY